MVHEFIDPVAHVRRRRLIDALPTYLQNNHPLGSPSTMLVTNFNVTADCHVKPKDHGLTLQFTHGCFQGGDQAFPQLHLWATWPSGTITLLRTQKVEHKVLDGIPPAGDTHHFSHPNTLPLNMLGSQNINGEVWAKYRGGSWSEISEGVVPPAACPTDFNPKLDIRLVPTNSERNAYVANASPIPRNKHDAAISPLMSHFTSLPDTNPPKQSCEQQRLARDWQRAMTTRRSTLLTKDDALRDIIQRQQATPAELPTAVPGIKTAIAPTALEVAVFQKNYALPDRPTPDALATWWYEVRLAEHCTIRNTQQRQYLHFHAPTAQRPTLTPVGTNSTFNDKNEEDTVPTPCDKVYVARKKGRMEVKSDEEPRR
ncbi:hypothetical protein HK104_006135 [Borealophlyctis nickersoniae]|nr:hypothetical protein HK104_006135 [Borealophlyctis nickersoniae]